MDKYQQHFCVGMASSSVCAYIGFKTLASAQTSHLSLGVYLIYGLAITGIFAGAYHIGWYMGHEKQQDKISELQFKHAELEAMSKRQLATNLIQKETKIDTVVNNSDSDDSEDYTVIKHIKFV